MKKEDKDARTLDIITHEVGLLEMRDGRSSPDDRRWAQDLALSMHAKIAEYRRSQLTDDVPIKKAEPITARLRAMGRAALETLFGSLVDGLGPDDQLAYRKLDSLSDNDLRRMIQTIETHTKRS